MSLMMVSMIMMMITRSIACGKRILEVLDEQPDNQHHRGAYQQPHPHHQGHLHHVAVVG